MRDRQKCMHAYTNYVELYEYIKPIRKYFPLAVDWLQSSAENLALMPH